MEKIVLAQIAYHAYGDWVEWKTPLGNPLPSWYQLPAHLKNAWTAATETVAIQVRKEELSSEAHASGF